VAMTAWTISAIGSVGVNMGAQLDIAIPSRSLQRVAGRTFSVPIAGCEDELRFAITFTNQAQIAGNDGERPAALEDTTRAALPARSAEAPARAAGPRNRNR
jgi:hypothetical protein